jgi:hypothetical protein
MKIIAKQIDIFKSVTQKNKYINQYIIYLMYDETPISAYIEYGEDAKDKKMTELSIKYQITKNITNEYLIN